MLRILVIDHDPMVRYALCLVLEDQGHATAEAATGEEALAALRCASFDAVITDMILPDMKGTATIRALHALSPELPILTMSSGLHAFALDHARDFAAIDDLLSKPFETDELMAALARTMGGPQPGAVAYA
jgi:CheY-like chemotaxis protein